MSQSFHLWLEGDAKGPFRMGQLRSMWNNGQVTSETNYTTNGGESWHPLAEIISELESDAVSIAKTQQASSLEANVRVPSLSFNAPENQTESAKPNGKKVALAMGAIVLIGAGAIVLFANAGKPDLKPKIGKLIADMNATAEKNRELFDKAIDAHKARQNMSKIDVLKALGAPDSIDPAEPNTSKYFKETWHYGSEQIDIGWNDTVAAVSQGLDYDRSP